MCDHACCSTGGPCNVWSSPEGCLVETPHNRRQIDGVGFRIIVHHRGEVDVVGIYDILKVELVKCLKVCHLLLTRQWS